MCQPITACYGNQLSSYVVKHVTFGDSNEKEDACVMSFIMCPLLQDIIHQMMEQGPLYSQIDYVNAFKLIAQSSSPPLSEDKLREHINRLDQVFSGDTV